MCYFNNNLFIFKHTHTQQQFLLLYFIWDFGDNSVVKFFCVEFVNLIPVIKSYTSGTVFRENFFFELSLKIWI